MCDIRFFKSAYHNWEVAQRMIQFYQSDELYINDAAYNLQQCVEKTLKAFLECKGVTIPMTHNIHKLLSMSKNNGSAIVLTPWIEDHAYEIESWESDTRYNFDFILEYDRIAEGITEVKKFLDANYMSFDRNPEIDDEKHKKLLSCLPQNINIRNDFELNCYYSIFKKKLLSK